MKFTTLAFSLSSAALGTAITIGDNVTMAVPAGQHYGPDGIQSNANAAAMDVATANAAATDVATPEPFQDRKGGIVIGDNNTHSGAIEAPYTMADTKLGSKEDCKDAAKPQNVALVAKAASGAEIKIDGSLGIKTNADGSAYVYIDNKAPADAQTFSLQDGVASGRDGVSLYAASKAEASVSGAGLGSGSVSAHAHASAEQKLQFDSSGKISNVHFYVSADMKVGISLDGHVPSGTQPIEVYKAAVSAGAGVQISDGKYANDSANLKTDYVTYVPYATTITLTTCETEVCEATELTITTATTITVRGGKVAASAHAGVSMGSSMATSSRSTAAATGSVSTYMGGAARNVAGMAGMAGMAALFL